MRLQLNRIIDAVKCTVPQQMWGVIAEKLDQPEPLDVEADAFDEADDAYDPTEFADIDDEL